MVCRFDLNAWDFAHRGLWSDALPENSLAAFNAAKDAGLGVELDVQFSADRTPMVFHDYKLDRMTDESGPFSTRSYDELSHISLLSSHEHIPSLSYILSTLPETPVLVEIKPLEDSLPLNEAAKIVTETLSNHSGPAAIMSFDWNFLKAFRQIAPDTQIGILFEPGTIQTVQGLDDVRQAAKTVGADFLGPNISEIEQTVPLADELALVIIPWTIRSPEHLKRARLLSGGLTFEKLDPALVKASRSA